MKEGKRPRRRWVLALIAISAIALAFHMLRRDDPDPREMVIPEVPLLREKIEANE